MKENRFTTFIKILGGESALLNYIRETKQKKDPNFYFNDRFVKFKYFRHYDGKDYVEISYVELVPLNIFTVKSRKMKYTGIKRNENVNLEDIAKYYNKEMALLVLKS
jgi:hypothetical protein